MKYLDNKWVMFVAGIAIGAGAAYLLLPKPAAAGGAAAGSTP